MGRNLKKYGNGLLDKPRIIVLSKKELLEINDLELIIRKLEIESKKKVLVISSSLREGLSQLLSTVWEEI